MIARFSVFCSILFSPNVLWLAIPRVAQKDRGGACAGLGPIGRASGPNVEARPKTAAVAIVVLALLAIF